MQYSEIKGLTERRRLPRLGKIRLGEKRTAQSGKAYPVELDYFKCPPEVERAYRNQYPDGQIRHLDVMFPVDDRRVIFPQSLKAYGSNHRLKCVGDGENAHRRNEKSGKWEPRECPCEWLQTKACASRAHLMVMLPRVNAGGVYQIDTGSYNSILDINSGLLYIKGLMGRVALIPLKLVRVETETSYQDGEKIRTSKHWTLQLRLPDDLNTLDKALDTRRKFTEFILPAPEIEAPEEPISAPVQQTSEDAEEEALPQHEVPDDIARESEAAVRTVIKALQEVGIRQDFLIRKFVRKTLRNNWKYDPGNGVCDPLTSEEIRKVLDAIDRLPHPERRV
jgi:hypothetical protein